MKKLGTQLIVELYDCDREALNSTDVVGEIMLRAAAAAKTTVVGHSFHKFSPRGVTGVVLIKESHIAVHTWPEYGYCAVDIFTCGQLTDGNAAIEVIREAFNSGRHVVMEVRRGLLERGEPSVRPPISSARTSSYGPWPP